MSKGKECEWCKVYKTFNEIILNSLKSQEERNAKLHGLLQEMINRDRELDGLGD